MKYLGNYFERKKNSLSKSQDKTNQVSRLIKDFLGDRFGDNLTGFVLSIRYSFRDNVLTIVTGNKILASELSICLVDIHNLLKKENIQVKQIIVR